MRSSLFMLICCAIIALFDAHESIADIPCKVIMSSDSIHFGTIKTIDDAFGEITLSNISDEIISIDTIIISSRWTVFTVLESSKTSIAPGNSKNFTFRFKTPHNISHTGSAIFRVKCPSMTYSISLQMTGKAEYIEPDFAFTQDLEGQDLYNALNKYLNESLMFSYSDARQFMFSKADNVNGTVECVYTGKTIQTTGIPNINVFNTEHSWPQSKGADQEPARSDIYIIYPSDSKANERRSNHPYGIVSRSMVWESGGSKLGLPQASADTVFEPRDKMKGNVARSLLYFATRYGNRKGSFDQSGFLTNIEPLMRTWNKLDPVDERERSRAISIASAQKRMNPYIAYPDMVDRMFKLSTQPAFPLYPEPVTDPLGVFVSNEDSLIVTIPIMNKGNQALKINSTEFRPATSMAGVLFIDSSIAPGNRTKLQLLMKSPIPSGTVLRIRFADGIPTLAIPISTESPSSVKESSELYTINAYPNPAQVREVQKIQFTVPSKQDIIAKLYGIDGTYLQDLTNQISWNDLDGTILHMQDTPCKTQILHIQSPTFSTSTLLYTGF